MLGKTPQIRNFAWGISLGLLATACVLWSSLPTLDAAPWLRVALFSTSGFAMLGLVFFFPDGTDLRARLLILGGATLLRLLLLPAPLSDDVNRYLWEGKLVLDGGNPYAAPADDPRWESRRDAVWQGMNHRDQPTAYPPGMQWIMAAAAAVSPTLQVFKVLAISGDLITLILLFGLLRHHTAPLRWAGFYAFNPVVLIAFAAEGHFDSLMVAAFVASLLAAERQKSSAWLWLGVAIQIKLVCLTLVPLFFTRKLIRGWWCLPLVLILPGLPFLSGLPEWWLGVRNFAASGAFNAPLFTFLASVGLPLEIVRNIGILTFSVSAFLLFFARWRGMPLIDASLWLMGLLLFCSPIIHFWYLSWLLPLAALRPSFAWTTSSITMGGYFLAWWTQAQHGWWGFGHGISACIWLPWFLAAMTQHRRLPLRKPAISPSPEPPRFSIVLPVLRAEVEAEPFIQQLRTDAEIIVVDAGTSGVLEIPGVRLISAPRGRGYQIAAGIAATDSPWILIAHSDSKPCEAWSEMLTQAINRHPDAALLVFGQRFDKQTPGTLLIEVLNEMRVIFGGVAFGDQTMVVRRSALDASGGFPAQPLMEDVEVSLRLASQGKVIYLGREWSVSSRKWRRGFGSRFFLVVRLVANYQLARLRGPSHAAAVSEKMYRIYYPD
jgi:hypothetical protein